MKRKKELLKKSRLYLILDKKTYGRPLETITHRLRNSKIDIIQLRAKGENKNTLLRDALKLNRIFKNSDKLLVINDYPEIAMIADADGVHLGQDDLPVKQARKLLGKDKIIGVSCHSLKQALSAQKNGADYIGIGPVFATKTKPDYRPIGLKVLKKLRGIIRIPYFAIGDIREDNVSCVASQGATRVAVCRAILKKKNIKSISAKIKKALS